VVASAGASRIAPPERADRKGGAAVSGNGQCNANNANYRVDTRLARAFLGQFLSLP
jgi:hypothetical protein